MIKYTRVTNYSTMEKEDVVVGVGTTLFTRYETVQVMSDVWESMMMVYYWDSEKRSLESLSNTEYRPVEYEIDADYDKIFEEMQETYLEEEFKNACVIEERRAANVEVKGRIVKVVSGKTAQGTVGKVVAMTEKVYGNHYRAPVRMKLAIALDDEMTTFIAKNGREYPCHKNVVWVWGLNCEVVNPTPDYENARRVALSETKIRMDRVTFSWKKKMVAA